MLHVIYSVCIFMIKERHTLNFNIAPFSTAAMRKIIYLKFFYVLTYTFIFIFHVLPYFPTYASKLHSFDALNSWYSPKICHLNTHMLLGRDRFR